MSGELIALRLEMARAVVNFLDDDSIRPTHQKAFNKYNKQLKELDLKVRGFVDYETFVNRMLSGCVDFENEDIYLIVIGGHFGFFDEQPTKEQLEELERSRLPDRINNIEVHPSGVLLIV